MLTMKRAFSAIAIAVAISQPLISTAQAKCEDGTRKTRRAIYNVVQHPPAMNTSVDQETRMFTPPPLDPNYHGSNGG
jgi:hypothetical protein